MKLRGGYNILLQGRPDDVIKSLPEASNFFWLAEPGKSISPLTVPFIYSLNDAGIKLNATFKFPSLHLILPDTGALCLEKSNERLPK